MDSKLSLQFITQNSASWITRLDDLTGQIASRQAELAELDRRPLKQKHGSTESLRPTNNQAESTYEPSAALAGAARKYQAQQLRRKRKTASLASASGATPYRTRSMIIVYYDSAVQEAFELIVRNIGTARNNIRKGKMAVAMQRMTAMVEDEGGAGGSSTDLTAELRSKMSYGLAARSYGAGISERATRTRGGASGPGAGAEGGREASVYDRIDAGLDFCQAQCERAAHQFLRDGECAPEILSIRNRMLEVTRLADEEMGRAGKDEGEGREDGDREGEDEDEDEEKDEDEDGEGEEGEKA